MLNLSTPEAIQAHKDYAKKTCSCCGVDISSKRSTAKFCSRSCKERNRQRSDSGKSYMKDYNKSYRQSDHGQSVIKAYQQTDKYKEAQRNYDRSKGRKTSKWGQNQKNSKLALRVNSMFTKATESQRHRLADWLLRVNHKASKYYAVDDWIADYNTSYT